MKKNKILVILSFLLIVVLFLLISFYMQDNSERIRELIGGNFNGALLYILILILSIVFAPVSSIPLIPVASMLWGWVIAGTLSIIGWTIGSVIAFYISKKYGQPVVRKFVSIEKINKIDELVPEKNLFLWIVFLRIVIPTDILSYALGLLKRIDGKSYLLGTLVGIAPFAFIFAYVGELSLNNQMIVFLIFTSIALLYFLVRQLTRNVKRQQV